MQWNILPLAALVSFRCFDSCTLAFSQNVQVFGSAPLRSHLKSSKTASVGSQKKLPRTLQALAHDDSDAFDPKTVLSLVGGQSVLIFVAIAVAAVIGTPNFGLGTNIDFGTSAVTQGFMMALPLGVIACALDVIEGDFPSLQNVTKATQRSILEWLGGSFKPLMGLSAAIALGVAAGLGEEMLFRGVLQYEIGIRGGDVLAVAVASVIFGTLHAVTPLYALLSSLASVYFGYLYLSSGNLAVPVCTHAFYDIGALFYTHWTVAQMSDAEQADLRQWRGPLEGGDD
mmetsp:Transcript_38882/g.59933  ORF Transcript_38882/g.59933 Transcript_38882/m.59933 type:complete len:285 (-) Transcript_38882:12-866(-)|eukprot:CAMPEP_0117016418 /NCGR_PEP_ID=MMETSP0472-20121206/12951_1 /TAXON_ID=693140 ORGANISM="Tiarina fusus, Strain LIS" /NCGR_SAMPLE_ID=MMETSP0472 /ASSEMBLY_ACC=CAM_ASM_000603 /LENGTH=284 /DNA_ID=CAMNT_0004720473 /DNA_START=59 /DNA_END=913 /DNA_ORIENTATION=+